MSSFDQTEFNFPAAEERSAAVAANPANWRAEWVLAAEALCQRLALPLNHQAEVRLRQGPVLRGRLCLAEEELWPAGTRHRLLLRMDRTTFLLGEIESVLRLDAFPSETEGTKRIE